MSNRTPLLAFAVLGASAALLAVYLLPTARDVPATDLRAEPPELAPPPSPTAEAEPSASASAHEEVVALFGEPIPREERDRSRARQLKHLVHVARHLETLARISAEQGDEVDPGPYEQAQERLRLVFNRGGGPEEIAWALEGVAAQCAAGDQLEDLEARAAAAGCKESIGELTGASPTGPG